jgi:biopolymer transport protein ExbB
MMKRWTSAKPFAPVLLAGLALPFIAHAQDAQTAPSLVQEVLNFIDLGGPVIAILLVVSVFGLAIALVKIAQFLLMGVGGHGFVAPVAELLRSNDPQGAASLLEKKKGPIAAVMRAAVKGRALRADDAIVREEVQRIAQAEIDAMERGLTLLALVAMVSPLLGLLGTVTGLIEAFQALAAAGDRVDPAILASGIWEALLTTVMGLAIGIPAAVIHALMQRTVDVAAKRMEDAATQVFTVDLYAAQVDPRLALA